MDETLYDYLAGHFGQNEPILLEEICREGRSELDVRRDMKRLTDMGLVMQYDIGVYYLPSGGTHGSYLRPSRDAVIEKKFLQSDGLVCGYLTGHAFAARLGLAGGRVAPFYEIVTNKERKPYRQTAVGGFIVVLKRPRVLVNGANAKLLQFLDLIGGLENFAQPSEPDTRERIVRYLRQEGITFAELRPYLSYYPPVIFQNLYLCGLLVPEDEA